MKYGWTIEEMPKNRINGSNTIFLANLEEIARNAGKCTMWQYDLSLQLNKNMKWGCRILEIVMPSSNSVSKQKADPFTQKQLLLMSSNDPPSNC